MIFPLVLAELGTLHADVAMQPRSVSRPTGLPTLNLPRRSVRIGDAENVSGLECGKWMSGRGIIADPLNKKKKIELRQGGTHRQIVSRGCDPLQRGTFLRRAGEWPILGTSPLPLPPRTTRRWEGGSAMAQSLEVMGNLRFPLTVLIMDVPFSLAPTLGKWACAL